MFVAPPAADRAYLHFAQSHYALEFLTRHGFTAALLTDFLNEVHFSSGASTMKRNIIVYNPKKGMNVTRRLMENFPEWMFVPIENMGPAQVAELLESAKVYIDFGSHPGKDRPPREAAIHGACVIVGGSGSSRVRADLPIDSMYTLDPHAADFVERFGKLVRDVFADFNSHAQRLDGWRAQIRGERDAFRRQVAELFP